MRKIYSLLVVLLVMPGAACNPTELVEAVARGPVTGSGNIISEDRELPEFDSVLVEGSLDAEIMKGEDHRCVVKADDNIVSLVITEVSNRNLIIRMKPGISVFTDVKVYVEAHVVKEASLSGSGDIMLSDVTEDEVELYISGSGDITAFGEVERLSAGIDGSGDMDLAELYAGEAVVEINGSGDIVVNASSSLECEINGSGDIHYTGNPSEIKREINGSGDIQPLD